jgi:Putative amidoligase enzyme
MPIDNLTFGVELECYLPEGRNMRQATEAVSRRIGEPVNAESYNHATRPCWKAVTDGSLGDYNRGVEFVSPVLRGEAGLAQLEAVCEALQDFGCTVNRSCGMHVHVGVAGQQVDFFKTLVKLYSVYEPVIDAFMPPSRRASNNSYCKSMTSASAAAIDRAANLDALILVAHPGPVDNRRYHKLNLVAFNRHRTVEFRQHSGTLDARKARLWTVTCMRMVEAAIRGVNPVAATQTTSGPRNRAKAGSKAHLIGDMLLRPEGVTRTEIIAATGWPSVSIPQQAGICGIEFTTQRTGREVRYFARAAAEATPAQPITLQGFCELIGADETERQYLRARTENLSGPIQWAA